MKKINKNKLTINQKIDKNSLGKRRGFLLIKLLGLLLVFGLVFQGFSVKADDIEEKEEDIDEYKEELKDLEKDEKKVETELNQVNQEISKTQSVIYSTNQTIKQFEETISAKEKEIKNKEANIKFKQQILAEYLRLFRRNNLEIGLAIYDIKQDLGKFLRERENYEDFQAKIEEALNTIKKEKEAIEGVKEEIEGKKEQKEEVLKSQQQQKQHLVYQENQKQEILQRTKASISEVQSKISKLQKELSSLLGKGYDTGDIKDAIKFANKQTGVSKGFLFGMLSMESGLGKYTGGCYYKESKMNDARKTYFKNICEELDYDYKKQKVSCPPKSYVGTGGAMGVAQFMSDTWWGYKNRIASATGNNPPDPWSLVDGVMAMALKLKNDGATESGKVQITNPCNRDKKIKVDWEDYAAMRYLGWSCYALTNYAPAIQNLKDGYDDL